MKLAKASKEDIDRLVKMFQLFDEFMEYGTHTPFIEEQDSIDLTDEMFVEKLRAMWGGRFRPNGVDASWTRVVYGCDVLIDNVCDPDLEFLQLHPRFKTAFDATGKAEKIVDELMTNGNGDKADRLALRQAIEAQDERDLGGYCRQSAIALVSKLLQLNQ